MAITLRHNILIPIQGGGFKHPVPKDDIDTTIADPVITACCNKVHSKEALIKHLGMRDNHEQKCPSDGCEKLLNVTSLNLFQRKSSTHRNEYNIHLLIRDHRDRIHPFTGEIVDARGSMNYAVGCCNSIISSPTLRKHFREHAIDLGSCPKCKSSINYKPLGYHYLDDAKNHLSLFENVARLTTAAALVAICLGSTQYALISVGVAIASIGLGILSHGFAKVDVEHENGEVNDLASYLFNCGSATLGTGIALAIMPFTAHFIGIGVTTALITNIASRVIADTWEMPVGA
ncbi:hypothetical protein COB11_05615 [Candidatus Aerophobetes bacterium]|uniref:Uncharacterized protein n=1 Tax=Aerophobetes bacterium TaxID=2030807 RepID=A0A2A4YEP5_UNCAE|nr:MAG: hypothetical protein COB11_05615 [Candidatus Aerophobetes bacterium]